MKRIAIPLLACLLAGGCATVKVSSDNGRTFASAENTCWKLLCMLPIGGGDCEYPNDDFCVWFKDTTTLKNNMKLLDYARERKGARGVKDVHTYREDWTFTFLIKRIAYHTSAELVY